ncbi:MAG: hypothetical protein R6T91_00045 [Bacteroidales bacterium]
MRRYIILVVLVLLQALLYAQYDGSYAGGRQAAMGGAAVADHDVFSVLNNPAAMGQIERMAAGVFFESRYAMSEFSTSGAAFFLPAGSGGFGLAFSYYGFEIYNEKRFVLAYGRQLFPGLRGGLSFDYLHTHLDDESGYLTGSKGVITFQGGLQADLSDRVSLGASVFNPLNVELSDYENLAIATFIRFGLAYKPDESFLLLAEAEQNLKYAMRLKAGVEYEISDKVLARGGIKTNPAEYSFGVGLLFNGLQFDISAAYHLVLGTSPHGSLMYDF